MVAAARSRCNRKYSTEVMFCKSCWLCSIACGAEEQILPAWPYTLSITCMIPFVDAMSPATMWAPSTVRFWKERRGERVCFGTVGAAASWRFVLWLSTPFQMLAWGSTTALLSARPGQRSGCPQENKCKRGDVGTLCCSSCAGQQSHGVILGWLLRVGALTPAHGRMGSCPHHCCHTLLCLSIPQEPHSWFFLQWGKLFPPITGLMCLNVPYVFPENPPQNMEH